MNIEHWPIERFNPYENNPRINDHAVEQFAEAIREFGFRVPILAKSDGTVIDGHFRLKAAKVVGLLELPVVIADDLSEDQIKAFRISVNRMAELADWDLDALRLEVLDLQTAGFDLTLTGLDVELLDDFTGYIEPTVGLTDPDAVPDIPVQPISRPGDLWLCGRHRVLCGDSTSQLDVDRLMAGNKAQLAFTDPPYNVNYQGKTAAKKTIKNDNLADDDFYQLLFRAFSRMAGACTPGSAMYVCYADSEAINFRTALAASGWLIKQNIIWVKNAFVLGRQDHQWRHEPILYGWLDGAAHRWYGDRKQSTILEGLHGYSIAQIDDSFQISMSDGNRTCILKVPSYEILTCHGDILQTIWRIDKTVKNDDHPTMKPVEVSRRAISNSTKNGERVVDLFTGSGSTMIGCEETGRIFYGNELDERYADVCVRRWQDFTGLQATLEGDGRTFDQLALERGA